MPIPGRAKKRLGIDLVAPILEPMMGQSPFRVCLGDADASVRWITQQLERAGLRVVKSFDLRSACGSLIDNICPHHGSAPCDCQLIVLLVYGTGKLPVSLILHSHRGQTELYWDTDSSFSLYREGRAFILNALEGREGLPYDIKP